MISKKCKGKPVLTKQVSRIYYPDFEAAKKDKEVQEIDKQIRHSRPIKTSSSRRDLPIRIRLSSIANNNLDIYDTGFDIEENTPNQQA